MWERRNEKGVWHVQGGSFFGLDTFFCVWSWSFLLVAVSGRNNYYQACGKWRSKIQEKKKKKLPLSQTKHQKKGNNNWEKICLWSFVLLVGEFPSWLQAHHQLQDLFLSLLISKRTNDTKSTNKTNLGSPLISKGLLPSKKFLFQEKKRYQSPLTSPTQSKPILTKK